MHLHTYVRTYALTLHTYCTQVRRQLKQEFNNLLCEGTNRISSEVHTCLYGVPLSLHNHYSPLPLVNSSTLHSMYVLHFAQ